MPWIKCRRHRNWLKCINIGSGGCFVIVFNFACVYVVVFLMVCLTVWIDEDVGTDERIVG